MLWQGGKWDNEDHDGYGEREAKDLETGAEGSGRDDGDKRVEPATTLRMEASRKMMGGGELRCVWAGQNEGRTTI